MVRRVKEVLVSDLYKTIGDKEQFREIILSLFNR
nr:MAG TPA: hypothetical protein [Crassvirales sp.]